MTQLCEKYFTLSSEVNWLPWSVLKISGVPGTLSNLSFENFPIVYQPAFLSLLTENTSERPCIPLD